MDQELQDLIHRLRDEKCPPAVLARVHQRIAEEKRPAWSSSALVGWTLAIVILVGTAVLWPWHVRQEAQRLALAEKSRRERVVQETQVAFGYIGLALIRAAAQTETALSKDAVAPIRNSFELIKNKLPDPI